MVLLSVSPLHRWWFSMGMPLIFVFYSVWSVRAVEGVGAGWKSTSITHLSRKVIDGDTFEADFNQDKDFSKTERVRLWYVDTPELSESHKGKNLKFGIPAKNFLEEALHASPSSLWIWSERERDSYERTLGILEAKGQNINLALIREGHSYFDTRFGFPQDFVLYAKAEELAFNRRRGIWSTQDSRRDYLQRLRKEGKTVYSLSNPLFINELMDAQTLAPQKFQEKFVLVFGTVIRTQPMNNGVELAFLANAYLPKGLAVVTFEKQREELGLYSLKAGDRLRVEGFLSYYKNRLWQIQMHRGEKLDNGKPGK